MQYAKPRLKELRERLNMSQYQIADALAFKQPAWARYESGKSGMNTETLIHICKTFNVSSDWLLGLTDEYKPLKKENNK